MITIADLDTWKRVELAVGEEARRLCRAGCGDECRGCGAGRDRDWRRDALTSLRRKAAEAEAKPEIAPGAAFDKFWDCYPRGRKSGKQDAKRVFLSIVAGKHRDLKASPEELILGAMRYAAALGDNHPYVAMPARWLREGRWQDDDVGFGHLAAETQSEVMTAFDALLADLRAAPADG